jgi:site-specific DNA-cytosine methylase
VNQGSISVSDPRVENVCFNHCYKVTEWKDPAGTVTSGTGPTNDGTMVADPRLPQREKRYPGLYKVVDWDKSSPTVIGQTDVQDGALNVSDPRIPSSPKWRRTSVSKVMPWDKPSGVVMGSANYHGAGSDVVADPRINCSPRSGTYGVQKWDKPSKTVTASGDIHAGSAAVADPRIPEPNDKGVFIIISEDGTWHRPITTFEMAMLQGLPPTFSDGSPLELEGNSDAAWREQIGNMVPPPAATAMGNAILATIMPNFMGEWYWGCSNDEIWVSPEKVSQIPAVCH